MQKNIRKSGSVYGLILGMLIYLSSQEQLGEITALIVCPLMLFGTFIYWPGYWAIMGFRE